MNGESEVVGEVNDRVDKLVEEIDRAIGLIEGLRTENSTLKQQCRTLQDQVSQDEKLIAEIRSERDELHSTYEENASLIEHRGEIQDKIEAMLKRLNSLNVVT